MTISTSRLDLVSLSPALVTALVAGDLSAARVLAPFPVSAETFAGDEYVLGLRAVQLAADPAQEPWLLRAAVFRQSGEVVGKVGFHAAPDRDGVVEIGYRVAPPWRRLGLAREMAAAALAWAAGNGAVVCLASVQPDNEPSLAIIRALGFERTGEQVDEIDGLEWIFTLDLTAALPLSRHGR